MISRILTLILLLLAGCATQGSKVSSYSQAKRLIDARPNTQESRGYAVTWSNFNNANKLDERDGCYEKRRGDTTFDLILAIDSSGVVTDVFPYISNDATDCWRKTYLGVKFPAPPSAPYYYRLTMR